MTNPTKPLIRIKITNDTSATYLLKSKLTQIESDYKNQIANFEEIFWYVPKKKSYEAQLLPKKDEKKFVDSLRNKTLHVNFDAQVQNSKEILGLVFENFEAKKKTQQLRITKPDTLISSIDKILEFNSCGNLVKSLVEDTEKNFERFLGEKRDFVTNVLARPGLGINDQSL